MKSFLIKKIKSSLPNLATISSRFSLGAVLALLPLLIAHYFDNDTAKTIALSINLSSYSAWLALGGYATVMRDFRLASNNNEEKKLRNVYQRLALLQSVGAVLLTTFVVLIYINFATPSYLLYLKNTFFCGLFFGLIIQCSSFWINLALGINYAKNKFTSIGMSVSGLRLMLVLIVILSSYFSKNINIILIFSSLIFAVCSIFFYVKYTDILHSANKVNSTHSLKKLISESIIYFKWSVLSTAIFLFPVTAISSIEPNLLLSATIAFFLASANQNLVAAVSTTRANKLIDGLGNLTALNEYIKNTAKIAFFISTFMLIGVSFVNLFINYIFEIEQKYFSLTLSYILICAAGFRSLTLAYTQAAITLKKENLVMLSPLIEATASVLIVSFCWLTKRGEYVVVGVSIAIAARLLIAKYIENPQIRTNWLQ